MERRISRLRVRPTGRLRKGGAPSRGPGQLLLDLRPNSPSRALRDGSIPRAGQSEAGRTGAHCAPLRGGTHSPSCCKGKRVASVLRENVFTREARPEGKGVDSQEGENRRLSPSCPQCGRVGRVPARWERVHPPPCRANTQGWRAEVVEPEETARRVVAQASFSWPFGPIHLLAPYETAASLPPVRARRAGRARYARPYGVAPIPFMLQTASGWQPQSGTTLLRAKRVLKERG